MTNRRARGFERTKHGVCVTVAGCGRKRATLEIDHLVGLLSQGLSVCPERDDAGVIKRDG